MAVIADSRYGPLRILPVTPYCPYSHHRGETGQGAYLVGDVGKTAATDEHGADGIDEIMHRVDIGGQVGPGGHGTGGGEQTAQQHQDDHEKPHHEYGLLHRVAVVGNNQAE